MEGCYNGSRYKKGRKPPHSNASSGRFQRYRANLHAAGDYFLPRTAWVLRQEQKPQSAKTGNGKHETSAAASITR